MATSSKVEVNSLSFFTAQSVLSGGIMNLLLGLISSLLMASDFETGFAKGIFSAQRNRLIYYAEKLILLFVLCIAAIIISLIISLVIAGIFGITFAHPDNVGNLLLWVLLMGLLQFIYASVAALLVWFMRSKAAGVLCAALVGSHVVGVLVIQILRAVFPSQAMTNALSWLPLSCIQTAIVGSSVVAQAAVEGAIAPGIHIALTGLIGSAIIIAVSLTFAPRKDI